MASVGQRACGHNCWYGEYNGFWPCIDLKWSSFSVLHWYCEQSMKTVFFSSGNINALSPPPPPNTYHQSCQIKHLTFQCDVIILYIVFFCDFYSQWGCIMPSQQTWDVGPTLVHCWLTVYAVGPTVNQRLGQRFLFAGLAASILTCRPTKFIYN